MKTESNSQAEAAVNQLNKFKLSGFILKNDTLFGLIGLSLVLTFCTSHFLTVSNLLNVLQQISVIGIIAIGMTFVIICGEIDLSVGSVVALSGSIMGVFAANLHLPMGLAIICGLVGGILSGYLTGLISIRMAIPSFIVTLASMLALRGLALIITNGYPATTNSPFIKFIGQQKTAGIPNSVFILLLIIVAGYILLEKSRFGRYVLAVGGNKEAARNAGIPVNKVKFAVFTISGFLAGLGGIVLAGQFSSGSPNSGVNYELDAIAAVVLGGTNLYGGKGKIIGTVMGILIIGVINNGLNLLNISPYYQMVVKGLIILLALCLNRFKTA